MAFLSPLVSAGLMYPLPLRRAIFTILKPIVSSIVWDPKGLLWCASQQFNQDN